MLVIKEALFLLFILQISAFNTNFAFSQVISSSSPTIVLDPGHGGRDHGCIGGHSHEKEIVLSIAQRLAKEIAQNMPNAKVILTRDHDHFVSLEKRSNIANEASADLFISLHCNAIDVPSVHGCETYVMGTHNCAENLAVAKRENNAILLEKNFETTYGNFDPNSDEGHIILSMFQNAYLSQSILFAQKIESSLSTIARRKSRGVKQAGFVVLRKTAMPSVLIELGFLTHPKEEDFLLSQAGQSDISASLLDAIAWYFNTVEQEAPLAYAIPEATPTAVPVAPSAIKTVSYIDGHKSAMGNDIEQNQKLKNKSLKKVEYRVQIAATKKEAELSIRHDNLANKSVHHIFEQGLFKYQVQSFHSLSDANRAKLILRDEGYKAAFIVPYVDGEKINMELAKQIEEESHRMANLHP